MIPALAALVPPEALGTFRLPDGGERPLVAPRDEQGCARVIAWAAGERRALLLLGGGTRLPEQNPRERVDLVLSTRNLAGVVAYEPGDGTLTARAGSTWAALASAVAAGGHHLAPDVRAPEQSTLGGVLASGAAGLDRLRHGPVRHQVLGARVALADGSLAKSGGALVKNVTGYDLHRLFTGSWGTLGLILEASLRLYARPDGEAALRARFLDRAGALAAAREVGNLAARPRAVLVRAAGAADGAGAHELTVLLAHRADVLDAEVAEVAARLPGAEVVRGAAAAELRRATRDRAVPALELALRPSRLAETLAALERAAGALGVGHELLCQPLIATIEVELAGADELPAERLLAFHGALLATGARPHWRRAPRALRAAGLRFDVFGPPPSGFSWMRRMKDALDPTGVFARGGFVGGL